MNAMRWVWLAIGYLIVMFLLAPVIHAVQDYKWEQFVNAGKNTRRRERETFFRFDTPAPTWIMAVFWPMLVPILLAMLLTPVYNFLYGKATWAVKEVTNPKENV